MSVYGEGNFTFPKCCGVRYSYERRDGAYYCKACDTRLTVLARPTSESWRLRPASVYAITKRDQEELCLVVGKHYGVPTIALRFFNVYGEGQALSNPYTGVIAIFASQLLNGKAPTVYEDGEQSRDFVHASCVARAVVDAVEAPPDVTGAFNVGTGRATTIGTVARILARELGGPEPVLTGTTRAGDVRHCVADVSKIRAALGWEARIAVEDGLRALVPYLRAQTGVVDRTAEAARELSERGLVG
jgi:dTDP-L-rhamnose 4-epimerase